MRARYTPWRNPATGKFVILDWDAMEYCRLPDAAGRLRLLTWKSKASADAFLQNCYITWRRWESTGEGTAPRRWRPEPERYSPYESGMPFGGRPPVTDDPDRRLRRS